MDMDEKLQKILHEAGKDAEVGENIMAYRKLIDAKEYSLDAGISFSEDDYKKKIDYLYQNAGLDTKISMYLIQAHSCASDGMLLYRDHISQALKHAYRFNDRSKRKSLVSKIRLADKTVAEVYKNVGLVKLKEKKSREIMGYARKGDFMSMTATIKNADPRLGFDNSDFDAFITTYKNEGQANKLNHLLSDAGICADKLDKISMERLLAEAWMLSNKMGIFESGSTWLRERQIRSKYSAMEKAKQDEVRVMKDKAHSPRDSNRKPDKIAEGNQNDR